MQDSLFRSNITDGQAGDATLGARGWPCRTSQDVLLSTCSNTFLYTSLSPFLRSYQAFRNSGWLDEGSQQGR